jgi:S1-C subfamily serine protease
LFHGRVGSNLAAFAGLCLLTACAADDHPVMTRPLPPPVALAPAANPRAGSGEASDGREGRRTLGVGVTVLDADSLEAELQGVDHGVKVALVLPGSAAAGSGIVVGDILLSLDGEALSRKGDIERVVAGRPAGTIVSLHLVRNGAAIDLAAQL